MNFCKANENESIARVIYAKNKRPEFLRFNWEKGERLKFGDVVTAVASLTVVYMFLELVMLAAIVPVNSCWGLDICARCTCKRAQIESSIHHELIRTLRRSLVVRP